MAPPKRKGKAPTENAKVRKLKNATEVKDVPLSAEVKSPYFSDTPSTSDTASKSPDSDCSAGKRLTASFYQKPCADLAKTLLGKLLVHKDPKTGLRLSGKIVETEAYLGREDKAAHSYKGKTERNTAMFMDPGTAYVYNIYGMYCCMNISSQGEGCAVLLRSLEPVENQDFMMKERSKKNKVQGKKMKPKELCNGPSKLCQALSIAKDAVNKQDMLTSTEIWLEEGSEVKDIVVSKRININYAEEWVDKPLRFYVYKNECVSVKDKKAEEAMSK